MTAPWEEIVERKRRDINAAIPQQWRLPLPIPKAEDQRDVTGSYIEQHLSSREVEITNTDAPKLVQLLSTGEWTAVEVMTAFCHRAALAHQFTNCMHEIFFDAAISRAKELDVLMAQGRGPVGPLHGLPVSFKDQFHIPGVETSMGYAGWIGTFEGIRGTGQEKLAESELVREVRMLGGVAYCKTSLPHTVMSMRTWNNIIGFTLNPHNRFTNSGGSSGGEAALIALKGSPIGFGTDIGGSVRMPSSVCGICALRPSIGRLSYRGVANSMAGQNTVKSVVGPMAPSVGALKMMTKAILTQEPWLHDPAVISLPWREEMFTKASLKGTRLVFGFSWSNGEVNPQPPVRRALETVKNRVLEMGHEVMEWNPPTAPYKLAELGGNIFKQDGGLDLHHNLGLSNERIHHNIIEVYGESAEVPITSDALYENNLRVQRFQTQYMDYWNESATRTKSGKCIDAIIAPVLPTAAIITDDSEYASYTLWVNVADYPAVVIPVIRADKVVDKKDEHYKPINEKDKRYWETYSPELHDGTPVGVQIITRRLEEEKALALAELLEEALGMRQYRK